MHTTHSLANVTYSYLIIANLIGSYAVSKNKKFRKCAAHSVWTECTATGLIYKNKSRQYKLRRIQSGHLRRHPPGWYRRSFKMRMVSGEKPSSNSRPWSRVRQHMCGLFTAESIIMP